MENGLMTWFNNGSGHYQPRPYGANGNALENIARGALTKAGYPEAESAAYHDLADTPFS